MKVDLFDFNLPRERIADRPASPRDSSKLLLVKPSGFEDRVVRELPGLLNPGDLLVMNDTRVIPARLTGKRGEAKIELTLHMAEEGGRWRAFARPAKKLRPNDSIVFASDFSARVEEKGEAGEVTLAFDREGEALERALEAYGIMPLPPYMGRAADARDRADYQTIYAREKGAVAAPTAGLHFTPALFDALEARGVGRITLTLHVGAGTFLPVKVEDSEDHRMHFEKGYIDAEAALRINEARAKGGRIVAVGTTSLRLLEFAADENGRVRAFSGATDLFITPGYRFRAVDLLMTNFHLPRSTLFMLVSAFSGLARMKAAYAHAMANHYRFYSYGDACLLYPGADL